MKFTYLVASSALLFGTAAQAQSIKNILQSPAFAEVCEQIITPVPASEATGGKWNFMYRLQNPAFTVDADALFVGLKDLNGSGDSYRISKIAKNDPTRSISVTQLQKPASNILRSENYLWALHTNSLTRLDLETAEQQEVNFAQIDSVHKFDRASDMIELGGKIYVAHGTAGLLEVEPSTLNINKVIGLKFPQAPGHTSLATSLVAISDTEMIVGVSNLSVPLKDSQAFNGLVFIDLKTGQQHAHEFRAGILSRQSEMLFQDGKLWINNAGTLQHFTLDAAKGVSTGAHGYINLTYFEGDKKFHAEPRGEFFIADNQLVSCAIRSRIMITERAEPKVGIPFTVDLPK